MNYTLLGCWFGAAVLFPKFYRLTQVLRLGKIALAGNPYLRLATMTFSSETKKNIWVINQFAGTPESGWGERHFFFAKHWQKMGHKVTIFSGSFNHMFKVLPEVHSLFKVEDYEGVKFVWVKTPKYNPKSVMRFYGMFVFAVNVLRLPFSEFDKPDVIIVSSMPIFPIVSGYLLKKKFGAKLIFEIRDLWPLTLQYLGNKSPHHPAVKFIGWFEKFGYRKADAVVSLLPNAKQYMEQVAGKPIDFHYIPNGIDPVLVGRDELPPEIVEKIPKGKFIVGYAGTIGRANALEYFVEAANLLKDKDDIAFLIVGDGYLKDELQKMARSPNIVFLPKVKKSQVQHLLSFFDVAFVGRHNSPLYDYGVSANKYFDYMLAAKPILASNRHIGDPAERAGSALVVEPESPEAIAEGVMRFYNMPPEERAEMGLRGYRYVLEHHNIAGLAEKYAELF